ncbi:MAG TPA: Fic family protein [Bacteroidia bacterium]|nr:Fic family protein [Bacteroidia bacterium]
MKKELQKIIMEIEAINSSIQKLRPLNENLNAVLQERLRIEWTYNSNAIEGNTLTFGETLFFLREGLTSEGRPLKDFLEAKNHAEAIDVLADTVRDKPPLSEFFIKSLHAVLLKGVESTIAKGMDGKYIQKKLHAGEYKKQPNHVLTASGEIHKYCEPFLVPEKMQNLLEWFNSKETKKLSPIEKAGLLHLKFVTIHPFDDGNGRISRLLMNVTLMQGGFPPCVIKHKHRKEYISILEKIQHGKNSAESFLLFIAREMKETMVFMERVLQEKEVLADPFKSLNKTQRLEIIENTVEKNPLSISQILEKIPSVKHATLKKDLRDLVDQGKIQKTGQWKDVVYFKE